MDAINKSEKSYSTKRREEIEVLTEFTKLFIESTTLSSTFATNSTL